MGCKGEGHRGGVEKVKRSYFDSMIAVSTLAVDTIFSVDTSMAK